MTNKLAGTLFVSVLLFLAGCKQDMDNTKLAPYLYAYAPVNIGHSVTYDVDSISYSFTQGGSQRADTTYFQIKEVVMDTFYDFGGQLHYGIAVYRRYDTTQAYPLSYQSWQWTRTSTTFQSSENDLNFIKLTFPPITGNTWQGNQYLPANDTIADTYQVYANWTYTYTSVNVPNTINGHHFDSTVVVTDVNNQNLISDVQCIETYALHVGLVYKQWEAIDKQDVISTWDAPNQANGFRIRMWYHSHTP